MAEINKELGRTYSEYALLPGYTRKDCVLQNASLQAELAGLQLKIPLLSAAMTSVTGYDMALALGKMGGLGVLPARLPVQEQADIVSRIKNYEMSFVQEPSTLRETATIEDALNRITLHGHSKVPIVDRNNVLLGMFTQQNYWDVGGFPTNSVTTAMLYPTSIPTCICSDMSAADARAELERMNSDYLVVLDSQNRLVKLAFQKDFESIMVGAAISTHEGWQERVKANVEAGVDLIVIDTSDAYSDFTADVVKEYKEMGFSVPICAGNIVTAEGAWFLMQAGADIVKVGMSSGSICTTRREKAVGRAPMSALIDVAAARDAYTHVRYVPVIMDGGIACAADMIISLTNADSLMLGGYCNHFLEAAGEKLDANMKETGLESEMRWVATWGEGSERAQNLYRYGHSSRKTFFAEGVEGRVPYLGRLKPILKQDLTKIKAAMCNAGSISLPEFREKAVIELLSAASVQVVSQVHNVQQ